MRRWDFFWGVEEVFGVDVVVFGGVEDVFGFGGGMGEVLRVGEVVAGEVLRVGEVVGGRLESWVLCFRGGGGVVFLPFVELPPPPGC